MRAKQSASSQQLVKIDNVTDHILIIRGQRVMLSPDLAGLYGVEPRALIQAVKRNRSRFPEDFMFQLTSTEYRSLVSQTVISSWGGVRRATPYAFTQEGVAMLSSVLRSARAVQVNIAIMRAFVRLRSILAAHKELARKIDALEKTHEDDFKTVLELIKKYVRPAIKPSRPIGFRTSGK